MCQNYMEEIHEIRKKLAKKLKPERYEHTLGVAFTSIALAMCYECDLQKAELAGLLHDCAKHFSNADLILKCEQAGIELSEDEINSPQVIHARYGEYLAKEKYHIQDQEILSAIRYHTLGRENMSLLEKIVFIADYIEPRRDKAPNLMYLRKLAFEDIDFCVYEIMKATVEYLHSEKKEVCSQTLSAYEYYKNKVNGENI